MRLAGEDHDSNHTLVRYSVARPPSSEASRPKRWRLPEAGTRPRGPVARAGAGVAQLRSGALGAFRVYHRESARSRPDHRAGRHRGRDPPPETLGRELPARAGRGKSQTGWTTPAEESSTRNAILLPALTTRIRLPAEFIQEDYLHTAIAGAPVRGVVRISRTIRAVPGYGKARLRNAEALVQ